MSFNGNWVKLPLEKIVPSIFSRINESENRSTLGFKCFIIIQMIFIWTSYTVTVRYSRSHTAKHLQYSPTTVVYLSEVIKTIITLFFIFQFNNYDVKEFARCIRKEYFGKPKDLLKMTFPSIAYTLQNNLDFVALSNLNAGIYHITTQLKIVTTAVFMMIILGRRFSGTRWLAIFLLFGGVAAVELSINERRVPKKNDENYMLGLGAVLLTCVTAGFAGVYFEQMLKDGSETPFWIRNLQMYSCGIVSAASGCILSEWNRILTKGFFYGYNINVIAIILFLSLGGIFISLVMKYLDNLYKSFASAVSIILVIIISCLIFHDIQLNLMFITGSITVCGAILLYSSVSE
ncbi:UDP-galactose transporter [Onchocerca flexuosa]|uniref:UDP-galactose transporter n=1 Tax=Onchocerca flexuosa TaxID=387005 RepID=A0A238BVH5_9BILA|nr:UDP-galactose transporter [Onchocerca flexuosa]